MFGSIFKHQRTIRNSFVLFTLALNLFNFVESKNLPAQIHTTKDEALKDPLVALPSEGQQINVEAASAQPQAEQPRYYAALSALSRQGEDRVSQDVALQLQPLDLQDQSSNANRQEGYYLVKPDGTVIQHVPERALEASNGKGRQEYISLVPLQQQQQQPQQQQQQQQQQHTSVESKREYPGEILYVDPNGEQAKSLNEMPQGQAQSQGSIDYSHVAGAVSRSSGLPATILTEVPIRDMPINVLERLRKDYGVRVVATREHPGANLVINCDEYSNQDNSICSRQPPQVAPQVQHIQQLQPFHQEQPNQPIQGAQQQQLQRPQQPEQIQHTTLVQYSPYSITSVDEHATDGQHSSEQPRIPGGGLSSTNYASTAEAAEPPQGFYETRYGESRVANQDRASDGPEFAGKKQTQSDSAYRSGVENQSEQVGPINESNEYHESENSGLDFQ